MLDHFDCRDDVCGVLGEIDAATIQINFVEFHIGWKVRVADRVHADVAGAVLTYERTKTTAATANVNERARREIIPGEGSLNHGINRRAA
jgi:hypothetical protein